MESITSPPSHIFGSSSFITPLMISVIGIISASLALLFYHYILVTFFIRRPQPPPLIPNTTALSNHQNPSLSSGVDKKILETIPIIPYSSTKEVHLFRIDQTECVVCLSELEHGEIVRLLPNCNHAFHVPCIDQWFTAHNNCPICRSPLISPVNNNDPAVAPPTSPLPRHQSPVNVNGASSSGEQSCGLLRHCASLVLPIDQRQSRKRIISGLKRSLSLDQSSVIIDIQSETNGRDCSSSSPRDIDSVTRRLYRAPSLKHFDRASVSLLRSFSRLRTGRNNEILPC